MKTLPDKKIGRRYRFSYYSGGWPREDDAYWQHCNQEVTILEKLSDKISDLPMYAILADDDWVGHAHHAELRLVSKPKPYTTLRDQAMELLAGLPGVRALGFHSDTLDQQPHVVIPHTSFSCWLPAESGAKGPRRPMGWKWAPRERYLAVMGPQLRPTQEIKVFWYATSNIKGSLTRGQVKDDSEAANIFASGKTSLEAVENWIKNYTARHYNER